MTAAPPLLVAMAGGKPRAGRARMLVPKEIKLHLAVANLLRAHCLPGWQWTHINRTAKDARQGKIFRDMGVNRGWADFELISPAPLLPHFLEIKRLGEVIEKGSAQDDFRLWCIRWGCPHEIVWTIDQ